ncbi:MAG: methionyl-tRNA formyltransferase [Verrucomicrobiae bacterium]|nr:methionyl-tRNA formyltransferase [Verrucomicrobiae bacterium]
MRTVFMGTAEFACPCLEALAKLQTHQIVAVVTQPDRPQGRHLQLTPPPVKVLAQRLGLPLLQPATLQDDAIQQSIKELRPELIVVVAYGLFLPKPILDLPPRGCINVHASLLPRWRGAAPIQHAILAGDRQTGVTTMYLNERMDAGDIILQQSEPILPDDTAASLHDRLARIGAALLVETLSLDNPPRRPQDESQATYARKLTKQDGHINWTKPAAEIERMIRAFDPWPGAHTFAGKTMLKLWKARLRPEINLPAGLVGENLVVGTGHGALQILELQAEGGRRMAAEDFLRGHPQIVSTYLQ